jgi:sialate O-acetylesterase
MKKCPPLALPLFALMLSTYARAEVQPNALFSDNAVIQQNVDVPVWGAAKEGEKVTLTFDGDTETTETKDGKWMVHLKPHKAGGPYTMTIAGENTITVNNVLVGEVWVCSGQSNMAYQFPIADNANTEAPKADYPNYRMFVVEHQAAFTPQAQVTGSWLVCSPTTVKQFSAVGYFFGRDLFKTLNVPVGIIDSASPGTSADLWTSLSALQKEPSLHGYLDELARAQAKFNPAAVAQYPQAMADYQAKLKEWNDTTFKSYGEALKAWNTANAQAKAAGQPSPPKPQPEVPKPKPPAEPVGKIPSGLFNGMIAPLMPYAIKGVAWYQGESNNLKPFEYRTLFPLLIADWREKWGEGDFPFLFVQIAPYKSDIPELKESQFLTWKKTANTAMVVTVDVGDANLIHPRHKEPVGDRLALAARALAYGEKIEYSGPAYDSMKIDGNKVILTFTHVGSGLLAKDGPLKGFTIAGADKNFVDAKAEINGDTVSVSSDQVPSPVAVRYAWANVPDCNLWNKDGLPASPFRTDPESLTEDLPQSKKPAPEATNPESTPEPAAP